MVFDALGRTTSDTDATGQASTMVWDGADNLVSVTDPADRRTATTYDGDAIRAHASSRATESYGPAPAADCYSGDTPTCLTTMPHTVTAYDSDTASATTAWPGLAATYWDGRALTGGRTGGGTGRKPTTWPRSAPAAPCPACLRA